MYTDNSEQFHDLKLQYSTKDMDKTNKYCCKLLKHESLNQLVVNILFNLVPKSIIYGININ